MSASRFICLVWCPILAASCTSPLLPESNPSFVTRILEAGPGFGDFSDALLRIHVDPSPDPLDPCGGLDLYVTSFTTIADSRGGGTVRASTSILEEGALVRGWISIISDSCPATAGVEAIERLE